MKNKIKKRVLIICAILLILVIQTIGVTYAKYIISENGRGNAEIAQFSFKISKEGAQTMTINLADTIQGKTTITSGKIAPGTYGVINVILDASGSEVDVDYTLRFSNEQNKPDNLYFTCDGVRYESITEIVKVGKIEKDAETKTVQIPFLWYWDYETGSTTDEKNANNILDTQYANSNVEYTFDIIATGTQSE